MRKRLFEYHETFARKALCWKSRYMSNSHEFCERINDQDGNGTAPLHLAIRENRTRVIRGVCVLI